MDYEGKRNRNTTKGRIILLRCVKNENKREMYLIIKENVAKQGYMSRMGSHTLRQVTRAKEYMSLLKSNNTVGFNIIDDLARALATFLLIISWPSLAMAMTLASLSIKTHPKVYSKMKNWKFFSRLL
ncbi:unnamed protein product [Lupinus luteus]|uniref:Uncharacterized protein n=1 Tax=Lupinus luteus TaxID=3873 RepID=A0AAV1WNW8_LUPLU